jgi:Tol biopolymer transport system component
VRLLWLAGPLVVVAMTATADGAVQRQLPPIAFPTNRVDHDLVVMRTDGRARRTLSSSGRDEGHPSWSPDGSRIAFDYYDGRRERVAVFDLRNGRVSEIGEGFNPDWSSKGQLVAVDAENFDDLVTMNADGSGRRKLRLTGAGIADETDPSWSRDGRRIAFVGDGLYVVNADGSELRRVRREGTGGGASWSPADRRIAFDCVTRRFESCTVGSDGSRLRGLSRQGRHPNWSTKGNLVATTLEEPTRGIELIRPDGRVVRHLRGGLTSPDWAPDGKQLTAAREGASNVRLYAIDPAGARIERLTSRRGVVDRAPGWAFDGKKLVFRRRHGKRCSLVVLDVQARRARVAVPRTQDRYCTDRADWSARGRGILYESAGDLWTVPPRGGPPHRLTTTRIRESSPSWAPDGRSIGFVAPGGIWIMRPDGARRLLVPRGGRFAWSRDGTSLAYSVWNGATEQSDLYVTTGEAPPRRLFEGIDGAPSWSPEGTRIAFSHTDADPNAESVLLVIDLAGNATQIDDQPAGDPDWRP